MKNIILSIFLFIGFILFFVFSFNITRNDFINITTVVATTLNIETTEKEVVDGAGIVENIENAVRDFWELIRLDRLFDILINFFGGVWEWVQTVFEGGIERTPGYKTE